MFSKLSKCLNALQEEEYDATKLDEYFTLLEEWDNLNRYPAELIISENVQFVGTINMDASTKDISPKVVDRSFMIGINKSEEEMKTEQVDKKKALQQVQVTMDQLSSLRKMDEESHDKIVESVMACVDVLSKKVKENVDVSLPELSYRGETRVREMLKGFQLADELKELMNGGQEEDGSKKNLAGTLATDIIISKIFPGIVGMNVDSNFQENMNYKDVDISDEDRERLNKELRRMYDNENEEFNYWRQLC